MDKEVVYINTHTNTEEYYSAIKKNEILPLATMWMDVVIIILSKRIQAEKDKYSTVLFICGPSKLKQMNVYKKAERV